MIGWKIMCLFFCIGLTKVNGGSSEESSQQVSDEDMNLIDDLGENGPATKYQKVIIMFCKAMNSKLEEEVKSSDVEPEMKFTALQETLQGAYEILQQLENFKPTYNQILEEGDFQKLLDLANKSLVFYKRALIGEYYKSILQLERDYVTKAHFFQLLLWLKFNMRHDGKLNESLEERMKEILRPNLYNSQPISIMSDVLSISQMAEECFKIQTLKELKQIGIEKEKIVEFSFLLAHSDGDIAFDTNFSMPSCDNLKLYGSFLNDAGIHSREFVNKFLKFPYEVLIFVFDAAITRCDNLYKYAEVETIQLQLDVNYIISENRVQYLRNVMIMFSHASEELILKDNFDEGNMIYTHHLDNFIIMEEFPSLEYDAIKSLILPFTNEYMDRFTHLEENGTISEATKQCYEKLLKWMHQHLYKGILNNSPVGGRVHITPDEELLAVKTLKDLKKICNSENITCTSAAVTES